MPLTLRQFQPLSETVAEKYKGKHGGDLDEKLERVKELQDAIERSPREARIELEQLSELIEELGELHREAVHARLEEALGSEGKKQRFKDKCFRLTKDVRSRNSHSSLIKAHAAHVCSPPRSRALERMQLAVSCASHCLCSKTISTARCK